ncbi:hypothetical protein [Methylobacterium sp. Leaf86]|uniref:hypothetical protein n=1 Tax=Methylobacterium sp. Leaf86 TaxID=1736242 RepID=UPI000A46E1DB|nr:hypothetical protein [Methylobacterium sp. Leaf86]
MAYEYELLKTERGDESEDGPKLLPETDLEEAKASAQSRFNTARVMAKVSSPQAVPGAVRVLQDGTEVFRWTASQEAANSTRKKP